ncbi:hypothetical protein GIB67_038312 [Kingdonia uniflora]|uniref:Uncharacterized protein n=1 Tax=Kingdonia uniflora TaxID=39325 RepID=A0A7J7KUJ1_9MAGN|nr:hypothetical protein GIB67_038312 [Kingdonia uniflora]
MRGSRARTNFVYSDMPHGSSMTSIISPDEAQQLPPLFVPPTQNDPTTQFFLTQDSGNVCEGFSVGKPWASGSISQPQQQQPVMTDNGFGSQQYFNGTDLPPLPSNTSDVSGYDMGQGVWPDSASYLGVSEQPTSGFDSLRSGLGFEAFDSGEYVHSPLFSRMPPVSDTFTDSFDLGPSSYFF